MPTSNHQPQAQQTQTQQTPSLTTDTNNNSNNKPTNGHPELTPGVTLVLPDPESGQIEASDPISVVPMIHGSSLVSSAQQGNHLMSSIKHHDQQHQTFNNNHNHSSHNLNNQTPNTRTQSKPATINTINTIINNNNNITISTGVGNLQQQNHLYNNCTIKNNTHEQEEIQQQQPTVKTRSLEELVSLVKDINFDRLSLTNEELIRLVRNQRISVYKLESFLGKDNASRCVEVRRGFYRSELAKLDKLDIRGINDRSKAFDDIHYEDLDYDLVNGACCENVVGHVKLPVGLAGPLVLDGEEVFVPLATTEGCLVASTCRGLSALRKGGGVCSRVRKDFMTRAPIIRFVDQNLNDAIDNVDRAIFWLNDSVNKEKMRAAFNSTSSHAKLLNYTMHPVNSEIHIRFEAQTGDAMGMNMCSKGVESALKEMQRAFPTMEIVTISGNMCTDKKAAGINWINGRGKSVECNARLPADVVQQVFKVSVDSLIDTWESKVMVGSALAASVGGFNCQAANILTAIFIATGQDPAQNVTSSNCILILKKDASGSLVVSCTMPSIECGTVGGGTILADQSRYLQMMGVKGPTPKHIPTDGPEINYLTSGYGSLLSADKMSLTCDNSVISLGQEVARVPEPRAIISTNTYTNARKLARIICATVMAGELSLLAALTEGTLVKSHMRHNRSSTNVTASTLAGAGCSLNDL